MSSKQDVSYTVRPPLKVPEFTVPTGLPHTTHSSWARAAPDLPGVCLYLVSTSFRASTRPSNASRAK